MTVAVEERVEKRLVLIRYKRLPDFCSACDRVGHVNRHYRDASVMKEDCKFGQWLRASRVMEAQKQQSPQLGRRTGYGRGMSSGTSGGSCLVMKTDKEAQAVVEKEMGTLETRRGVGVMVIDGGGRQMGERMILPTLEKTTDESFEKNGLLLNRKAARGGEGLVVDNERRVKGQER